SSARPAHPVAHGRARPSREGLPAPPARLPAPFRRLPAPSLPRQWFAGVCDGKALARRLPPGTAVEAHAINGGTGRNPRGSILVVDDSRVVRAVLASALRAGGYAVT